MRSSLMVKVFLIGLLTLVLLVPLGMVRGLVRERESRRDETVREVSSTWGLPQELAGPVLVVPYRQWTTTVRGEVEVRHSKIEQAYFLPDELRVRGRILPESRARGLYEVIVFDLSGLELSGSFRPPDLRRLSIDPAEALWDQAFVVIGIADARALPGETRMSWGGRSAVLMPGVKGVDLFPAGVHLPVTGLVHGGTEPIAFACTLDLRGSSTVSVAPLAAQTSVELSSSWPHPSFFGSFLPDQHEVSKDGFTARWNVSYFGSGLPQQFTGASMPRPGALGASSFGVKLYVPVDFYQKSERAVKYGLLFIGLTFLVFFLFELFVPLALHPLQYLLVGLAMCLFYLLFLSLTEHVGFLLAYTLASAGVVALVGGYCAAVLGTRLRALLVAGLLVTLYGFLFVLLENEAYALLLGSLALFVILATVMYLTRRVDWYGIRLGEGDAQAAPAS